MNANQEAINEINQICESIPNILDGKGIIIATFTSAIEPNELNDWFKLNNRNFLYFDLDSETSGFNIVKKEIHNALFGFLRTMDYESLKQKQENFLKEIKLSAHTNGDVDNAKKTQAKTIDVDVALNLLEDIKISKIRKLSEIDINNMNNVTRIETSNELIDFGVRVGFDKLTDTDKKILQLLSK